ncbi:MAG: hypothetical protein HC787_02810 [Nostocaceae cyanobacterium CSU_2_110]|nr:hypothetical protein [Nostocaceae cyanobacterium CSU_2_110]
MTDDEFDLFVEHAEDCEFHAQFLEVLENQAKPIFELMFANEVVPVKPFLPKLDAARRLTLFQMLQLLQCQKY